MRYLAYAIVTISVLVSSSLADTSFTVTRAELVCPIGAGDSILEFVIDKSLNATELIECDDKDEKCKTNRANLTAWISKTLHDPKNYHLMRLDTGAPTILNRLTPATTRTLALDNTVRFSVTGHDPSKAYFLLARDVTFEEDPNAAATVPFMIKVAANSTCSSIPKELPEADKRKPADLSAPKFTEHFSKAAVDDSPRLKVDFSIQGSKKKRVISSFNVNFRPYTTRRIGFGGHYEITPFFIETEYQVNADGADKKDVLNIGVFDTKLLRVFRDDGDE